MFLSNLIFFNSLRLFMNSKEMSFKSITLCNILYINAYMHCWFWIQLEIFILFNVVVFIFHFVHALEIRMRFNNLLLDTCICVCVCRTHIIEKVVITFRYNKFVAFYICMVYIDTVANQINFKSPTDKTDRIWEGNLSHAYTYQKVQKIREKKRWWHRVK